MPGEPESVADLGLPDVLVLRSLTKTWALPGLRVGYALGDPVYWSGCRPDGRTGPLGTLQLEAIAALPPRAVAQARADAEELLTTRAAMAAALAGLGLDVVPEKRRLYSSPSRTLT